MAVSATKSYVNGSASLYMAPGTIRLSFTPNAVGKVLAPRGRGPVTFEVTGVSQGSIARFMIELEDMGRVFSRGFLLARGWTDVTASAP